MSHGDHRHGRGFGDGFSQGRTIPARRSGLGAWFIGGAHIAVTSAQQLTNLKAGDMAVLRTVPSKADPLNVDWGEQSCVPPGRRGRSHQRGAFVSQGRARDAGGPGAGEVHAPALSTVGRDSHAATGVRSVASGTVAADFQLRQGRPAQLAQFSDCLRLRPA